MLSRRDFLRAASVAALSARCTPAIVGDRRGVVVNDIHSQLNETTVSRIVPIDSPDAIRSAIATAKRERRAVSIAGGRHAMGGQQFGQDTINLDMRPFHRIGTVDAARGVVTVESGVEWPELVAGINGQQQKWGIRQKQTGADRLTIGGALAANVHGRGLTMPPFANDVEDFTLVDANGESHRCSRTSNPELFSLAAGGYGLFGVASDVTLRLMPRVKVRRVVEIRSIDGLMTSIQQRIADGFLFGDFQFSTDEKSERFMRTGVFSCYQPVSDDTPVSPSSIDLTVEQWSQLMVVGHLDKARAYDLYTGHYMSTNGQVYWSDTHQLSVYIDDYHRAIDARAGTRGSEMIGELYVPRTRLADFMEEARADFLRNNVNLYYGTVRMIERDTDTFLRWAKEPYACVVFNLHIDHTPDGKQHTGEAFRRLIDMAIARNGSYYLTYHRFARRDQVERCYPQLPEFLRLKKRYDPDERFQSDWYRFYKMMFS